MAETDVMDTGFVAVLPFFFFVFSFLFEEEKKKKATREREVKRKARRLTRLVRPVVQR